MITMKEAAGNRPCERGSGSGVALLCGVLLSGACGDPGAAGAGAFMERDSAGIVVAHSTAPGWPDGHRWTLGPEPELVIGMRGAGESSDESIPLSGVTGLQWLPGGQLGFGNRGSREILVYDSIGGLRARLGGSGGGPGELRSLGGLYRCGGDTLVVPQSISLDLFHPDAGFIRRIVSGGERRLAVRAVMPDCQRVLLDGERQLPPIGQHGHHRQALVWADTTFEPIDTLAVDSIPGVWTRVNPNGGPLVARLPPWTAWVHLDLDDTLVVRGHAVRPELLWHAPDGHVVRVVRWDQEPTHVTRDDRGLYAEKRRRFLARVGSTPSARLAVPQLDEWSEVPETKPYFDAVLVDGRRFIWLKQNPGTLQGYEPLPPHEEEPPERWLVLDADGRWLGDIPMPDDFSLHDIAGDRALGVYRDSLDVETVRIFHIDGR